MVEALLFFLIREIYKCYYEKQIYSGKINRGSMKN